MTAEKAAKSIRRMLQAQAKYIGHPYPLPGDRMAQHKRKQVELRIKRIHGHVHAIAEMLEEGRSYSDVVHQLTAVRAALDGAIQVIVDDLVEDCVSKVESNKPLEETLHQLQSVVAKIR
jgi:DNA-binding FrmR family transcriptional regulator